MCMKGTNPNDFMTPGFLCEHPLASVPWLMRPKCIFLIDVTSYNQGHEKIVIKEIPE